MGANTEYSRLNFIETDKVNALLGIDTKNVDSLVKKKTDILAVAKKKDELLSLADKATELLALLDDNSANDNSET